MVVYINCPNLAEMREKKITFNRNGHVTVNNGIIHFSGGSIVVAAVG